MPTVKISELPENDDIEENVRLLATPHGDPMIDDQTKDFYML
jgi:hypothetical protein